jgi:hypothetical protein
MDSCHSILARINHAVALRLVLRLLEIEAVNAKKSFIKFLKTKKSFISIAPKMVAVNPP